MTMRSKFLREVTAAGLPQAPATNPPVTDADLARLPATVQRYLRSMGVVGRPRDWSLRLSFTGRFRMKLDGRWAQITSWQYNTRLDTARIFHMRLRIGGLLPVLGRDSYLHGRGRMLGKALDLLTVVDGSGSEYDVSELVTYLNDAILFAPSMILGPETAWTDVDEHSFDVSLTDRGTTVSARVFVDPHGAPTDFSTTDRFAADRSGVLVRYRWTTPVEMGEIAGRPVCRRGQAIWHLPEGPKPYAEFSVVPGSLAFNVPPGA